MKLTHSYADLGELFAEPCQPVAVSNPAIVLLNEPLLEAFGLERVPNKQLCDILAGNQQVAGSRPVATAYAGHQFGQFNPYMGDGRAHLLGDITDQNGLDYELQLKGSGRTPFSKQGDGRCALGPAIREFLLSESMQALGVPTTRVLATLRSGEQVFRHGSEPGGIVARLARSHIRVGTFQYFAARQQWDQLRQLVDYALQRLYPHVQADPQQRVLALFKAVVERQIELVTEWLRVGFIHGVMNTDNCAVSGETIDFGPCAMLSRYHPGAVFSSIDRHGRYAFGAQPGIVKWNMARFAEALLPIIDDDEKTAMAAVMPVIDGFDQRFAERYQTMLAAKLGLEDGFSQAAADLIGDLLAHMQQQQLDYTQTFLQLTDAAINSDPAIAWCQRHLGDWFERWKQTLHGDPDAHSKMKRSNPRVIARNHHVERLLASYQLSGDDTELKTFLKVIRHPYQQLEHTADYQDAPEDGDQHYKTFCGT